MSRSLRRVLAAAVCSSLVLLQGPAVAAPMSTSVADASGDQTQGDLWQKYPKLRSASDLRNAVFATSKGTLTMTWTFGAWPSNKRAFQNAGMSGRLNDRQVTFSAWRHDGKVYAGVFSGLGNETTFYCEGKGSVSLKPKKRQVVFQVPVSCLPKGKVFQAPYPTSNLTVLNKKGIVEGYVASDSGFAAPNFAIRS